VIYAPGDSVTYTLTSPTNKLFDGYTKDGTSSGLYYAGARFYSADLGRFLSPDPVGGNYANPQSLNPYSYVRNL
jgi:RHS repeat-associated protein